MRSLACLAVLLLGCGRVSFDPTTEDALDTTCTPANHDEDGDGVDDACDVCPHVADSTQADGDRDGVGDLCDPEPALARQQLIGFDPFVTLGPPWSAMTTERVENDELVLAGAGASRRITRPYAPGHDTFVIGGAAGPAASNYLLSIMLTVGGPQPGAEYCELLHLSSTTLKFTYTLDDSAFMNGAAAPAPLLADGSGILSLEVSPAEIRCQTTWRGAPVEVVGPRPSGVPIDELHLYAYNIDVRLAYFVQIRTLD